MIDLKDFIVNKHNQKKYKFYCDDCGRDRGYLFKNARGGRKTGDLCVRCKNSQQEVSITGGFCKHCNDVYILPKIGESDNHWFWEMNLNSINNGYFRCRLSLIEKNKKWVTKNPEKNRIKQTMGSAKRRASKLKATPTWLTEDHKQKISEFYNESSKITAETNKVHHVDHIVPLQGKNVSGLHVPWNLRVTTAEENLKKSNKLIDDTIDIDSVKE